MHSSVKLLVNDSDIDKAFVSMHKNLMRKIKRFVSKDRIVNSL